MLRSVLIANRGEIAVRIAATCRRLGIRTVAVFSDADAGAMHVAACDEAVRIGPAAAAESYLRGEAIIAAALAAGAEAIHPGYGFLSENAGFAEAVGAAGLVWIGPPSGAIRAMGLKDAAKARMEAAGVPIVPGWHGAEQDARFLAGCAAEIGFPVLIKARAGGGGKGMRLVERAADFAEALESAAREAASSFGDGAVLVEKYVATPRHVEVQVFADAHGNAVHLFERDCSLQRRHQKVIEEAPAPGMTPEMRAEMGAAAVRAAQAVGYVGAGTVEFIADASEGLRPDRFYFMEMNTRLQVEHPVTEAVCGVDLVEWQLRVASGEPLPRAQAALGLDGWAVEARLYAEDAAAGFLPATGRLRRLRLPSSVRVDAGVREGDTVTPHYDPMIAKLIAHAPTREAAFAQLAAALDTVEAAGCVVNAGFLARLLRHGDVAAGRVDTGLIARAGAALADDPAPAPLDWALAAAAALDLGACGDVQSGDVWSARDGWRAWGRALAAAEFDGGAVRLHREGPAWACETPAGPVTATLLAFGDGAWSAAVEGRAQRATAVREGLAVDVFRAGRAHRFRLTDPLAGFVEAASASGDVRAPMPGLVKAVHVAAGDAVAQGDRVATLEAMKMEHALRAPLAGVVARLDVAPGDLVEDGALLATIEAV
ncbi:biotin carboxylase N-terminal domain-containing protein [Rubrimonas cliftonensis]|uniref:3-methylcrotonyl-CoA carboxylase alpha subunit n=1 Tax=Rubrimonas cliftonensis TaxID=89524 RepID=A0A1H3VJY3_9RHOB|nr:biotin carboxylase N-terminal domain-containing protein [Rubrimonas cliftonensis]SDZ75080.1 3-methylcrotonyl-CoA carboxylase alpha subunit [Rubrimonas cliftonensis]